MPDKSDQFMMLAKSEMVKRAVQAMPHNRPLPTDDRFAELLKQLSYAELNKS